MKIHPDANAADPVVLDDRRRPGRTDVAPELVHLLRENDGSGHLWPTDSEDLNPLSVARGIKLAFVISAPIWALAVISTFWLLR